MHNVRPPRTACKEKRKSSGGSVLVARSVEGSPGGRERHLRLESASGQEGGEAAEGDRGLERAQPAGLPRGQGGCPILLVALKPKEGLLRDLTVDALGEERG